MNKFWLISSLLLLSACGSMSVGPGDPFYDDPEPDLPITLKLYIDPGNLPCSILNPCDISIGAQTAGDRPVINLATITTQNIPAVIATQLPENNYQLVVTGLPDNYHVNFPNGNQISSDSGSTLSLQIDFESGIVYTQ